LSGSAGGEKILNEKILAAEDDPAILAGVCDLLKLEGYEVLEAANGAVALELYKKYRPDLVILDVMMPLLSGYDVCRAIRREDELTPILMLTAKGEEVDKVVGLELGADDYIVKPFGVSELLARVRSALRRAAFSKKHAEAGGEPEASLLRIGAVVVDFDGMVVRKEGKTLPLTPKETELLKYFTAHPGRVLSRETLLDAIWGIDADSDITTRSVDTHVARLRQKIESDSKSRVIETVHGAGYKYVEPEVEIS
jgi:DNA-binding response OmpR family regulator